MDLLMIILLLLFSLLLSNIVSHYIPSIPAALIQIAIGIILALVFAGNPFELETEWFLLLFVAPLLYNDGRHYPREELWKMRVPILSNAIILVILTTIMGGCFVHWLIPDIPLAAAFALTAILSPTDPVAVNGIARRIQIPEKVLSLVKGESLINDASGLVAFNYAVAAVITSYFSIHAAILDFSYKFLVGAISGFINGFLITWLRFTLRKQGIVDVTFHSLLQILTPFVIYIITEEFLHASGIIGVVVAGIVHALVRERTETLIAEEQVLTEHIWSIVLFILNGVVFLLLGLNIPSSMTEAVADPSINNWMLVGYVCIIGLVILGIRLGWSYIFFYHYHFDKAGNGAKSDFKTYLMISLTGVRGAVTMAGVLSIPYFLASGNTFPQRSLILFIAAGVILFTLVAATIFLPILSTGKSAKDEAVNKTDISAAKRKIILEAINRIHAEMNDENKSVVYELMDEYKTMIKRIHREADLDDTDDCQHEIKAIRLLALKKEREYINGMMERHEISEAVFDIVEKFLDRREEALSTSATSGLLYLIGRITRNWNRYKGYSGRDDRKSESAKLRLSKNIHLKALQSAYHFLEGYEKKHERANLVHVVIMDYKRMIDRLKTPAERHNGKAEEQKEEMHIKVMDIERSEIRRMFESGEITREQAKELRRFVNNIESVTLYEYME